MGYKISVASLLTALVLSIGLVGWSGSAHAESAEELKAQLQAMQEQMQTMQKTMQDQMRAMQAMQNRINELEGQPAAETPARELEKEPNSVWTKYNMKLYGKIKTDFHYDTARITTNDYAAMIDDSDDHKNDSTNFNPRDARFGFQASHGFGDWVAKGRFEIDFYGDNKGDNLLPRMRLAYTDISNTSTGTSVRVGQDWIPVATLNPNTLDFGILSAAGNLWWRIPQITVRQRFGGVELTGSVMKHRRTDTAKEDRMPWVLARAALNGQILGDGNLLAVGAGYRHADYGTNNSINTDRWLVVGEAKYNLGPVLFQGELWTGQGLGSNFLRYDLDMADKGVDADGHLINDGPASAYGGWFDLTYKLDAMSFTAGYGFDNPDNDDIVTTGSKRFTRNEQYYLNAWYTLTKPLKVGIEWIHIETERHSQINTGNRYTASMMYCF